LRTPALDVHIHVFSAGSQEIRDYLDFRDWLRVDDASRTRYEAAKRELARLPWRDGNQYAIAKTTIVSDLLRQAREGRCDHHRAVVRRLFDEVWNGRQYEALDELYAPEYIADYRPYGPLRHGPDGVREMVEAAWATFPDYREDLLSMVAEGWRVAVHLRTSGTQLGAWGPLPATGERLEFEEMMVLDFDETGRVVHQRGIVDNLLGLRQAGVMPTPT
jgi:predicted ester cyclase